MATTSSRQRGFVPARLQGGGSTFRTKLYPTSAGQADLYIGDPVCLVLGKAKRWTTAQAANFLGVVESVYDSNRKPLTFTQPTRGPYLLGANAGFVNVFDDPDQTYTVECEVSAGPSAGGQWAEVKVTAGVTATGISRTTIIGVTAADGGTMTFRAIGVSPDELDNLGGTGNDIEVIASRHVYRNPA